MLLISDAMPSSCLVINFREGHLKKIGNYIMKIMEFVDFLANKSSDIIVGYKRLLIVFMFSSS